MSFIGPPLPPGLCAAQHEEDEVSEGESKGPPRTSSFGPRLPPHLTTRQGHGEQDDDGERERDVSLVDKERLKQPIAVASSCYGPTLPSKSKASSNDDFAATTSSNYGPSLPPGFGGKGSEEEEGEGGGPSNHLRVIEPAPPPDVDVAGSEEEEEVIGPMPVMGGVCEAEDRFRRKKEIEYRAKVMKDKILGKDVPVAPQREEWMTELPPEIKPSGIGPRKFRTTVTDLGDRSVWTDTPADIQRKAQEAATGAGGSSELGKKKKKKKKKEEFDQRVAERDKQLAEFVDEHNKKHRSQSLMEMHSKKRKIEEQDKGKVQERRPFDRDTDLDVRSSLITPTKRKALMKDSRSSLNTKFTHGSRSFL